MVKTRVSPTPGIQRQTAGLQPEIRFVHWGIRFFAGVVKDRGATNPGLLELVYHLGDDGRQELALSVFNFLREQVWKDFCRDRLIAKGGAKKSISKAISDLRRARVAYSALLKSVPEISLCRRLGEGRHLHLSDILEEEAVFLSGQARLARAATGSPCLAPAGHSPQRTKANHSLVLLSKASVKLTQAAKTYRELLTLTPYAAIGRAFDAITPAELVDTFEIEEADLRAVGQRVDSAFNKKRLGASADWAILIRLQYFVEAFGLRWKRYLPAHTTMSLRESDIGDLLEAGKAALGLPENSTLVNAESIGRALERFRQHKGNQRTCESLRQRAQTICDRLKIRPPSRQIPAEAEQQISTF